MPSEEPKSDAPGHAFARTYGWGLVYAGAPEVDPNALLFALRERMGKVERMSMDQAIGSFMFPDLQLEMADAVVPAQIHLMHTDGHTTPEIDETLLQQTWRFDGARDALARGTHELFLTDLMSSGLNPKQRLTMLEAALDAVLGLSDCIAIKSRITQQVIDPAAFQAEYRPGDPGGVATLNVRAVRLETAREAEGIMDTLGLAAVGLPDLQCHFDGFDWGAVAGLLGNYACYLIERGDVIEDGNTVDGVNGEHWHCEHQESLLPPKRVVVDIDPGPPFNCR